MPNCTPGNKECGKRCIPESYNCGAADPDADLSQLETRKRTGFLGKTLNRQAKDTVTTQSAQQRLAAMEKEAYNLAGGKKEYEKELKKIIKDTGGGIKARIIRSSMSKLAPNLMKADDLNLYLTVKKRGRYEEQIYRRDRSKFKQSDVIRKGDKIKKGDILRVRFGGPVAGGFGYHYGVYMGNGKVIQYGNQVLDPGKKKARTTTEVGVYETDLKNINKKGGFKWEKVPGASTKFSPEELDARAAKVKNKKIRYNMMSNNCEHFSYLLTHGKAYSSQADISDGIVGGVVKSIFHYIQLQRRQKVGLKHDDFFRLDELKFAERLGKKLSKKNKSRKGNSMDKDFRMPKNEKDIEKDIITAMEFASSVDQDPKNQIGALSGWLKEYIENITVSILENE